ncbi:hypothetical protein [Parasutterella sp.]|uniref:hypothetical protein n=1 Tax=Parasutterella sp. TaxID=2049037 RepID=UPI0035201C85
MNILLIAKMGAAVVALFIAYWIGLNDGKNSEELKKCTCYDISTRYSSAGTAGQAKKRCTGSI